VEVQESSNAVLGQVVGCDDDVRRRRAFSNLQVGPCEATDARMHIPNTLRPTGGRIEVVLDVHGTAPLTLGGHDHVPPFDTAMLARLAHLNDGLR